MVISSLLETWIAMYMLIIKKWTTLSLKLQLPKERIDKDNIQLPKIYIFSNITSDFPVRL